MTIRANRQVRRLCFWQRIYKNFIALVGKRHASVVHSRGFFSISTTGRTAAYFLVTLISHYIEFSEIEPVIRIQSKTLLSGEKEVGYVSFEDFQWVLIMSSHF